MAEQANQPETNPSLRTCRLAPSGPDVTIRGSRYAIVGVYAEGAQSFVCHTALLKDRCNLDSTTPVDVWHIGPPIVSGPQTAQQHPKTKQTRVDVIGDLALSESECEAITDWRAGCRERAARNLPQTIRTVQNPAACGSRCIRRRSPRATPLQLRRVRHSGLRRGRHPTSRFGPTPYGRRNASQNCVFRAAQN